MPEHISPPIPRAYSYLRFSTPEQRKGDSARRQSDMATRYAAEHALELDTELTFQDLGVSAYRGQNAEAGRLADFMEAVQTGLVPRGSYLLVEQLDRLSRLTPRRAFRVLEDIVDAGITVVTLNDGRAFTAESLNEDQTDLFLAILTFFRANEESRTKSRRLKASWEGKRLKLHERPLTSRAPAWLKLDKRSGKFVLRPDRAAIVRRIFTMTLDGVGQHKIAETLHREGVPVFGSSKHWQRSYIAKILASPATIGVLTPHVVEYVGNKRVRKPLEPVEDYYPAAVERELWDDVQALMSAERSSARGRHAAHPIQNILAGLAACPVCGGTFTRVQKGKRSIPHLVCARAKAGAGCDYRAVRYATVEKALTERLAERLRHIPAGDGSADDALLSVEEQLDAAREAASAVADELLVSGSDLLRRRLRALEDDIERLEGEKAAHLQQRARTHGPLVAARVRRLQAALAAPIDPQELNTALKSVFTRAVVDYPNGTVDLKWGHGGEDCSIPFMLPSHLALGTA